MSRYPGTAAAKSSSEVPTHVTRGASRMARCLSLTALTTHVTRYPRLPAVRPVRPEPPPPFLCGFLRVIDLVAVYRSGLPDHPAPRVRERLITPGSKGPRAGKLLASHVVRRAT